MSIDSPSHARDPQAASLTALGRQRLAEAPMEGMRLLDQACRMGDPEAAAMVAVLLGAGFHTEQSWPGALDYLTRAAEAGWSPARAQLDVLREGGADVDIEAWLTPPPAEAFAESPRVEVIARFMGEAACEHLISMARPRIRAAPIYDPATGGAGHHDARSNSAAAFGLAEMDLVLLLIQVRIARAVGSPLHALESPNVLHYAVGQSFEPHHDWLDRSSPGMAADLDRSGQRTVTFLVYLNEGFEGGETDFPAAGLRYRGGVGDAVLFHNVDAEGRPDPASVHAGLPPTSGEKWILSQWVRQRPS